MNIFKWSQVIPVLFKHITEIFGENSLSLLRYNADQFWFLKIKAYKSLWLVVTGWREPVGFPVPPPLPGGKFGANGGALTFCDLPEGPGAWEWIRGDRDSVQLSGAQFLCRAAESEARLGQDPWSWVSGHHHLPPYCPATRQGGRPQWSWGPDPGGGTSGFCQPPLPAALHLQRGDRGAAAGQGGPPAHFLSPLCMTMHPGTKLPTRERDESSDHRALRLCLWLDTQSEVIGVSTPSASLRHTSRLSWLVFLEKQKTKKEFLSNDIWLEWVVFVWFCFFFFHFGSWI